MEALSIVLTVGGIAAFVGIGLLLLREKDNVPDTYDAPAADGAIITVGAACFFILAIMGVVFLLGGGPS